MDNIQRNYLLQLEAAKEKSLKGDAYGCLQICFELRLKADLALYIRALVCITICDLVSLEEIPEKLDLAVEALRLATELKEDSNPEKNSFWTFEYDRLEKDAEAAVEQARSEERAFVDSLIHPYGHALEAGMGEMSLAASALEELGVEEESDDEGFQYEEDSSAEPEVTGMPPIEGLFTVSPAAQTNEKGTVGNVSGRKDSSSNSGSTSGSDTLMPLPALRKSSDEPTQLETPAPSSRQGSVQP